MEKFLLTLGLLLATSLSCFAQGGGQFGSAGSTGASVASGTAGQPAIYTGTTTVGSVPVFYYATANGLKCDGVTDDTAALVALDLLVFNAGGGTILFPPASCLIPGHVLLPNNAIAGSAGYAQQPPIHWQGVVSDHGGEGYNPTYATRLLMTYNGAGTAKIETYGIGNFEIDHISFYDSTSLGTLPFILTTGTTINAHENAFVGNCGGLNCVQDVFLLGGFNSVFTGGVNDPTAAFQGYNTKIINNYFQRIRRADYQKTYAGSVEFKGNFIGPACGSNLTAATLTLSAAATASAGTTVYTGTITGGASNGLATQAVVISGFITAANNSLANQTFNIVSSTATTITVTNKVGVAETHAGTAVMTAGAAVEYDGSAQVGGGDNENVNRDNRYEMTSYPYAVKMLASSQNTLNGNDVEDGTTTPIAMYYFNSASVYNFASDAVACGAGGLGNSAVYVVDANGANTYLQSGALGCGPSAYNDNLNFTATITGTSSGDPNTYHLKSTNNNDESYEQLFHGGSPSWQLFMKPAGGTAESMLAVVRSSLNNVTVSANGAGGTNIFTCSNAASGYCFFQAISGGTVRIGTAAAIDQLDVTASLISLGSVPLKWQSDGGGDLGASNGGRPGSVYALTKFSTPSGPVSGNWNCVSVTPVTQNTSTVSDQNLATCTIPAATLNSVNKTLRLQAAGVYSTPAASVATINLKVKLCTVSGCGSGTVLNLTSITSSANPGSVTNNAWSQTAWITVQTAGASALLESHGILGIDLGAVNTAADSFFNDTNTAVSAAIDSTAQLFLQISGAFSVASGSNSITQRQLVIDSVN